jgi:hypothetical protein
MRHHFVDEAASGGIRLDVAAHLGVPRQLTFDDLRQPSAALRRQHLAHLLVEQRLVEPGLIIVEQAFLRGGVPHRLEDHLHEQRFELLRYRFQGSRIVAARLTLDAGQGTLVEDGGRDVGSVHVGRRITPNKFP